jgi:sugar lactone lactonase YvrE
MVRWSMRGGPLALASLLVWTAACGGGGDDGGGEFARLSVPAPPAQVVVDRLVGPMGLTFDESGNLYVGSTTGRITRIAPDGDREIFAETDHELAGLATGPQDEIFAAAPNAGQVFAISQGGGMRVATSGLDTPTAIVFDGSQRALVSARGRGGSPQIAVIEPDATYHTLTTEIRSPSGMAFAPNGRLYVADTEMNRVMSLQLDRFGEAGLAEVAASGIELPIGVAFDQRGDMFVSGGNAIWAVRPGGAKLEAYVVDGALDHPAMLAFGFGENRDTGNLFFANYGFPLGSGTTVARAHVGIPGRVPFAP